MDEPQNGLGASNAAQPLPHGAGRPAAAVSFKGRVLEVPVRQPALQRRGEDQWVVAEGEEQARPARA